MNKKHIVLFGSMSFLEQINKIKEKLILEGFDVTSPKLTQEEIETGSDTFMEYVNSKGGVESCLPEDPIWKIKHDAMFQFFEHIEKADLVLVCNFDKGKIKNRIGDNTFMEMSVAFYLQKKICILQGPPYQSEKIEEVLGMRPIFLNGNIGLLKNI